MEELIIFYSFLVVVFSWVIFGGFYIIIKTKTTLIDWLNFIKSLF